MKKNIAMRVAAFLFILTMISTCAFATTFAKYVTDGSATDTARVAKWGVTVGVTGNDAFSVAYKNEVVDAESADLTVKGSENVVAPGTKGTLFTLTIGGTPEVDTKVTVDFSMILTGWEIEYKNGADVTVKEDYCPLEFTVSGVSESIKMGGEIDTVEELVAALEAAVEGATRQDVTIDGKTSKAGVSEYNANEDIARTITVSWSWAFEGDDVKDTVLGNWDLNKKEKPTINFNIACTVEQVD